MIHKQKKLTLTRLQEIDRNSDESYIRNLEMIVDGITGNFGYSIQFWRDFSTYGLSEAVIYLKRNFPQEDYVDLDECCRDLYDKFC